MLFRPFLQIFEGNINGTCVDRKNLVAHVYISHMHAWLALDNDNDTQFHAPWTANI